jgi:hypothetical protein
MKTLVFFNSESKNQVINAIVDAIRSDRMIGRHIAEDNEQNGSNPVYGIKVLESIVHVYTDTNRNIFDKAIERLLKEHTDLFKWADFQKVSENGPHIVLALTEQAVEWVKIVETSESVREYIDKIKAEAMARVPYKKGDRIKDNQGQEGVVLDVSPNIWWNNYGVPYIMSQWGMISNPHHFDPSDPNDNPDVDARVQLDNGKIWAGGYHMYHPVTLESAPEIKAVCIEGVSLTAEKRAKWTKTFSDVIREHTIRKTVAQYNHDCGCIRVNVAYRNESDKPEDWTYCVAWYKWRDIEAETVELVECENGILLEQAARAMADFHLLADAGLTLQQILYPAA